MLFAHLNEPIPLRILATDGSTALFGQIRIYNAVGTLVATLDADSTAEGIYTATWTPNIEGYYSFLGQLYTDIGRTIDADYEVSGDTVEVDTVKASIARLLGLHHENAVIDQQVYDADENLTSCRVRCYDSKPNALAAGVLGLLFVYAVTASYVNGLLTKYTMVRDA